MMQEMTPEEIKEKKPYLDWSLSEEEYAYICDKLLHRLPNYTETGLFSAMWSEHCSYKKSKPVLRLFPTKGPRILQGPGEGAGVVDIGDGQAVVFKAESHNHPTAVEPYQGAATGVGGILRDVFSMGARPVATLDSLHFGELDDAHTRWLLNETVAGIGGYGNCMGIPTVGGELTFDDIYKGNPVMNAMSVGLLDVKDMQKGLAQGEGNAVMYVGAKTGRDGIHGATFASHSFDSEHESQRSAVQVGDPFMEKLLLEACLELTQKHTDWLVGIQDMGAAGIVSSSSEMASEGNSGMELNLDLVPQRESGMSAYEIMLSESQERMLLCVKKGHEEDVKKIFDFYDLDAVVIGRITSGHNYVLRHHGEVVCDIPVTSLTEDVLEEPSEEKQPRHMIDDAAKPAWEPEITDLAKTYKQLLAQPTIASKEMFTQTYDSMVRTSTVVGPGEDSGVLRVRGTHKGIAMTTDGNGRFIYLDPEIGGKRAVVEAASNIIASGAEPLAITDCLNFGNPNEPEVFWELHHSVMGIAKACEVLETPVVSGNVSLYNETDDKSIYPTPMVGMVGLVKNLDHLVRDSFHEEGDDLYLVGQTGADYAGSELQKMLTGEISGSLNDLDLDHIHDYQKRLLAQMEAGHVASAHDLSEGGLAVSLAESSFGHGIGAEVACDLTSAELFSETPGRFLVSVPSEYSAEFAEVLAADAVKIGQTAGDSLKLTLKDQAADLPVSELKQIWEEALPCLMKSKD